MPEKKKDYRRENVAFVIRCKEPSKKKVSGCALSKKITLLTSTGTRTDAGCNHE